MKLLYCSECQDIFKLDTDEKRSCKCGKVTGHYINNSEAVTNGEGVSIAIGNGSLWGAIIALCKTGNDRDRKFYLHDPGTKIHYAWVRPNEGTGNPHTKIIENGT